MGIEKSEVRVLAIAGSLRSASLNKKALQIAKKAALDFGASINELDLKVLDLPMFNEDLAVNQLPESVVKMKSEIEKSDVIIIATPEYNNSIPGPLKNAIDWASYKKNSFSGKFAIIFGASAGIFGTIRAQLHLRQILTALNVDILPQPQIFIRLANDAFLEDGSLADQQVMTQMQTLVRKTLELVIQKKRTEH